MHPIVRSTRALVLAAAALLAACQMPPSEPVTPQPALVRYAVPHASALAVAGVAKIVAWSDRPEQPVQVLTHNGAIYFAWPRGVPFASFALDVTGAAEITVRADGYAEADRARYAGAIDAAAREALRLAGDHNARVELRERARQ
jgi:hypothetical protein